MSIVAGQPNPSRNGAPGVWNDGVRQFDIPAWAGIGNCIAPSNRRPNKETDIFTATRRVLNDQLYFAQDREISDLHRTALYKAMGIFQFPPSMEGKTGYSGLIGFELNYALAMTELIYGNPPKEMPDDFMEGIKAAAEVTTTVIQDALNGVRVDEEILTFVADVVARADRLSGKGLDFGKIDHHTGKFNPFPEVFGLESVDTPPLDR